MIPPENNEWHGFWILGFFLKKIFFDFKVLTGLTRLLLFPRVSLYLTKLHVKEQLRLIYMLIIEACTPVVCYVFDLFLKFSSY